jgi:phosphoribosylamine-glycine ligase
MRVGIVSGFACSLSWWLRLQSEGAEVRVWIEPKESRTVGEGLVNVGGDVLELIRWVKEGHVKGEKAFVLFDATGKGELADAAINAGIPVVCGGKFMDRLEKDREFGFEIAESIGAVLPPFESFESFDAALEFAQGLGDTPAYFKSDRYLTSDATHGADNAEDMVEYLTELISEFGSNGKCIIQQKIDGVPISTARWWNGRAWVGPAEFTIEHKKLLNGDVGPATGCALNAIWFDHAGKSPLPSALGYDKLAEVLREKNAPAGIYDMNALVAKDGTAYFLEWTPRLGYDSELTSFRLMPNLFDHLYALATGGEVPSPSEDLAYGLRIGIPPYPYEHTKGMTKTCEGQMISGEIGDLWSGDFVGCQLRYRDDKVQVASPEGIIGVTYAQGLPIEALAKKAEKAAKALKPTSLLYRTDGAKVLMDDAKAIKKAGYAVHPDLL